MSLWLSAANAYAGAARGAFMAEARRAQSDFVATTARETARMTAAFWLPQGQPAAPRPKRARRRKKTAG